jgi:hypothetical protein
MRVSSNICSSLLLALSASLWSVQAVPAQPVGFAGPTVSDAELDSLRGGMVMPNGMDVEIGVDIQTLVDGELLLHTSLSVGGVVYVYTGTGQAQQLRDERGSTVTVSGDDLTVQHLVGRNTGIVIANTADNRAIDTLASIDIDLKGAWPVAANAMFVVNGIAADAAARN